MTPSRVSVDTAARQEESSWKRLGRWFAVGAAIFGFVLIGHEIWENISCPAITLPTGSMVRAAYCAKIHLGSMMWGVALITFGLITIQKGDASTALKDVVSSGSVVRNWFGRRAYDKVAPIDPAVKEAKTAEMAARGEPLPGHSKEEDLSHD